MRLGGCACGCRSAASFGGLFQTHGPEGMVLAREGAQLALGFGGERIVHIGRVFEPGGVGLLCREFVVCCIHGVENTPRLYVVKSFK